jgi:small-conductance mechanosensitive channel
MMIKTWSEVLIESYQRVWAEVFAYVPNILISVIIFIFGWIVASVLGRWVAQLVKVLKLDNALESLGLQELVNRAGYKLDSGAFIGALVKLFIIVVFLVAALEVLGLATINDFLSQFILGYIPKVIVATLILLLAALIADALRKLVIASAKAANIAYAEMLGNVTKWVIWIFAILTALDELNIGATIGNFTQTLFAGLIAMLALAGGLAFGLGGRDVAAKYLDKVREDIFNN